jgi:peroxiredoxin
MKKLIAIALFSLALNTQAQIAENAEDVSPLLIGEKIPNIELANIDGKKIESDKILNKKTVLVVYRGGWCPYCNRQLADMQDIESQILDLGYQIVAISPDSPKFLKETESKDELNYALYSDSEGKLSQAIGIAFKKEKGKLDKYS